MKGSSGQIFNASSTKALTEDPNGDILPDNRLLHSQIVTVDCKFIFYFLLLMGDDSNGVDANLLSVQNISPKQDRPDSDTSVGRLQDG